MVYTVEFIKEWEEKYEEDMIVDGPYKLTPEANEEFCLLLDREYNMGMENDEFKNDLDYVYNSVGEFTEESEESYNRVREIYVGILNKYQISSI